MLYIILTVCFSVTVSVLFKLARRYHIDVYQAVTWNYSIAIILTWLFLKPQLTHVSHQAPFLIYSVLGILLPSLFLVIAACVSLTGIVRTEVAQRLSLFIPIVASFFIFGEQLNNTKVIGIIVGFTAIICCIPWQKHSNQKKIHTSGWIYLLIVFLGMGIIDMLLKQITLVKVVSYNTSLFIIFCLAFCVSFIGLIYQVLSKKMRFSWPHILIGWMLGIANFANIFCYIKAHKALADQPSSVFSGVNIGVIVLGTLTGIFVFKEKLSLLNKIGIGLAIAAISIIYYF